MKSVRVHRFGGLDELRVEDVPVPEPGPEEVRVRVEAVGVNFADILMIAGLYQVQPDLPFAPGFEVSGVVDRVGHEVTTVSLGTRVTATPWYGGYSEYVVVPIKAVFELPADITAATAVASTVSVGTAYHGLVDRGRLQAGETVLVTGATGGIGSAAMQVAKVIGARVIAAVGSREKESAAFALGAEAVVTYDGDASQLRDQIKDAAGGDGIDVVVDPVGGNIFEPCLRALATYGRFLVVGFAAGSIPKLRTNLALLKEISIVGVFWGAFREREPEKAKAELDQIWQWIGSGDIDAIPTATYPLDQATAVLGEIAARQMIGKAVLLTDAGAAEASG